MVQFSQLYMTTGKTIALTMQTFGVESDVSAFQHTVLAVIAFLPISNRILISWLQSPSTVILETKKKESVPTSTFSPSICYAVMGVDAMILVF